MMEIAEEEVVAEDVDAALEEAAEATKKMPQARRRSNTMKAEAEVVAVNAAVRTKMTNNSTNTRQRIVAVVSDAIMKTLTDSQISPPPRNATEVVTMTKSPT